MTIDWPILTPTVINVNAPYCAVYLIDWVKIPGKVHPRFTQIAITRGIHPRHARSLASTKTGYDYEDIRIVPYPEEE